jgi:hypothetical protein
MGLKTTIAVTGATALVVNGTQVNIGGVVPTSGQVLAASSSSAASWSSSATLAAYFSTFASVSYASSVSLNTAVSNDFIIGALTGSISISFANAAIGRQGSIYVKQDGSGGRSVTIIAPSTYTIIKDSNISDLSASTGANTITCYAYIMVAIAGSNYLQIAKSLLV